MLCKRAPEAIYYGFAMQNVILPLYLVVLLAKMINLPIGVGKK